MVSYAFAVGCFLALQSATIVAVLTQSPDTFVVVRIGDVIFTAEFSSSELKLRNSQTASKYEQR